VTTAIAQHRASDILLIFDKRHHGRRHFLRCNQFVFDFAHHLHSLGVVEPQTCPHSSITVVFPSALPGTVVPAQVTTFLERYKMRAIRLRLRSIEFPTSRNTFELSVIGVITDQWIYSRMISFLTSSLGPLMRFGMRLARSSVEKPRYAFRSAVGGDDYWQSICI
jgi:hypothetical protein